MTNNLPGLIEALRSRIVSDSWIGKRSRLDIIYLKLDVKVRVGRNILAWSWVGNDGCNHVRKGGDVAHSY